MLKRIIMTSNLDKKISNILKEEMTNMLTTRQKSFDRGMAIQMQIKDLYAQLINLIEQQRNLNPNDQELQDCVDSCLTLLQKSRFDFRRRLGEKLLVL